MRHLSIAEVALGDQGMQCLQAKNSLEQLKSLRLLQARTAYPDAEKRPPAAAVVLQSAAQELRKRIIPNQVSICISTKRAP